MRTLSRIFGFLVWVGGLLIAGAIILSLTASRVGEHRSSTYGQAYSQFQASWGGEIGIVPPDFKLKRTIPISTYNATAERYELSQRIELIPLIPQSIQLDSDLYYGEQRRELLTFNAFEAQSSEIYRIANQSDYFGELILDLSKPHNANLMYDYKVVLPDRDNMERQPVLGESIRLLPQFSKGEQVDVLVTYTTKGMDVFKYNLSAYQNFVIPHLQAQIRLNTQAFEVYRFGLPHNLQPQGEGAVLEFDIADFSTTQDLGISFVSKQMYLDQIQSLMRYSPLSLGLFIAVIFFFAQIQAQRFHSFHYFFVALLNLFYFLFVAYLIRFLGVFSTFALASTLTAVMFLVYCPNVFGWRFALRIVGVYLFLLTTLFSLIFLLPVFRGLLFVLLIFLVFMSLMIFIGRSDIATWPIMLGDEEDTPA